MNKWTVVIVGLVFTLSVVATGLIVGFAVRCSDSNDDQTIAPTTPPSVTLPLDWWQETIIYQIYPRSFADSDGDGVGDLKGIEARLDHVTSLNVRAAWLSPIYESPMKDFGYDISDFVSIDPIFGTMGDFDSLLEAMHKKGLKVIMDFVPNHTSDLHRWFTESKKIDPNNYTDYYIWADKRDCKTLICKDACMNMEPQGCPPNNWLSAFGGSAWEWVNDRAKYYLHQFLKEQPDLNYNNERVRQEMKDVLRFWMNKGVDGFRMDAVSHLHEQPGYPDEPLSNNLGAQDDEHGYLDHIFTMDQPETFERIREWRQLMDEYGEFNDKHIFSVAEAYTDLETMTKYYDVADMSFNFELIPIDEACHTGYCIKERIDGWINQMGTTSRWPNWVLGNHDNHRIATRMGEAYVNAMNALLLLLPGTPTTYYGEEIGMLDHGNITFNETRDPYGLNFGPDRYQEFSRDPERTPMQWDSSDPAANFSTSNDTWLPMHPDYKTTNVESQDVVDDSTPLNVYKALAQLRAETAFRTGAIELADGSDNLIVFGRNDVNAGTKSYLVIINVGWHDQTYNHASGSKSKVAMQFGLEFSVDDIVDITAGISLQPAAFIVLEVYD
ncbi:PREDICTED: alpha-glucosidase-like [Priapulus caudatus]|uniref:alpha-glucosidase n=1 Tax=Priapulus caudatus TaxID=37621 RepID=A0ABM1DT16_PRICU|nr:PREDICTED: alpha-glucosidase-like [Priapulus caudatus]